jgi:kumamolisin
MTQTRRLRRTIAFGAVALLALSIGWVGVDSAAAADSTSITVFLRAPNAAGLAALAGAQGLTHAERVAAVDKLLPTSAEHQQAAQQLAAEGLTVTGETSWSVSATGSSSTIGAHFGSRPALTSHASVAQRRAATGALPDLPSELRSVATAAYPTSGGPAAFGHATLAGSDFRNAYTSPGITPDTGKDAKRTLTIATIQLSGWTDSDLSTYANDSGQSFSSSQITEVPVDGASTTPRLTDDGGDIEVDLDQESILSTDPYAHQRPYFADNTEAGYADALSQVLDDVTQNSHAYNGGDKSIVALSTSWGSCEAETGNLSTMNSIIESLVAAGVTMFASTGDSGIYDCQTTATGVDYPASSPYVVGVGGTTLVAKGNSAANTGSNWTETGWSCTTKAACVSTNGGGGGGGASSTYDKPTYQSAIGDAPFASSLHRLVPDIAADANPATGFEIYTSELGYLTVGGRVAIGGTSLASPLSAALFTNTLAASGATAGIGDIHAKLYAAYAAKDGAFRDVTSGTNGVSADRGSDPSVNAKTGYDTVGGLGAPLWPKILDQSASAGAPTLTASIKLTHPHSSSTPRKITASWKAKKSSGGAAVKSVVVDIVRVGPSTTVHKTSKAKASGTYSFTGKSGATYALYAEAVSTSGIGSKLHTATVVVPIDDKHFSHHGAWKRIKKSTANGGSILTADASGAYARVTAKGREYSLVVEKAANRGKLAVYQAGRRIKTINLYRSATKFETVRIFGSAKTKVASRTFTFRYLGSKSGRSSSPTVDLDALDAIR